MLVTVVVLVVVVVVTMVAVTMVLVVVMGKLHLVMGTCSCLSFT